MTVEIELSHSQSRAVVVHMLAETVDINKQYLSDEDLRAYKHVLKKTASLVEIETIRKRFDKMWPTDVTWDSIREV